MLSKRENFLETLKKNGKPDRLVKQYEAIGFVFGNPVTSYVRGTAFPGMPPKKDRWGTVSIWPEGTPGAMPHITPETKVIPDISCWRDFTKVPDLIANCDAEECWLPYLENQAKVGREGKIITALAPTGVFERLHYLMGFEDTFINLYEEPEAMQDLCEAIGEYRLKGFKLMVEHSHPELMLSHDDWGDKRNLFMPPELWREFIKPQYEKAYNYLHEQGVIILHHSDSFLEPIIEDMIDLHIDIWQGVLPQNDIVKLQEQIDGRMALMGGIDAAIVDRPDSTEEEIRTEVRRACDTYSPGGNFIPCITYGMPGTIYKENNAIIDDEIDRFNAEHFGIK
ncbi:MAG: uroporphyrinogen decarboxylase (URO-D) [Ruminococcaceae bacterium]|nr:uroporphyrinogen decarboxylase (URO-D) [Oscillospiraceae bacterium]